jgi:hypothetical protein
LSVYAENSKLASELTGYGCPDSKSKGDSEYKIPSACVHWCSQSREKFVGFEVHVKVEIMELP